MCENCDKEKKAQLDALTSKMMEEGGVICVGEFEIGDDGNPNYIFEYRAQKGVVAKVTVSINHHGDPSDVAGAMEAIKEDFGEVFHATIVTHTEMMASDLRAEAASSRPEAGMN